MFFIMLKQLPNSLLKMVFQGGSTRRISIEGGEYLWRGALKKFFEGETVSKAVKFLDLVETSRKLETN